MATNSGRVASVALVVLFLATPGLAQKNTPDETLLDNDSRTSIRGYGDSLDASLPYMLGDGRFALAYSVDGRPPRPLNTWQIDSGDVESTATFVASDESGNLEFRRSIQVDEENRTSQTLTIRNLGDDSVEDLRVLVKLDTSPGEQAPVRRTLAEHVYGFQRVSVATRGDDWRPPSEEKLWSWVAITSRHVSIVFTFDTPVEMESVHAQGDTAQPGQDPDSWRIRILAETLGPEGVATQKISVMTLPTETSAMAQAEVQNLIYADLWTPIGALCEFTERSLKGVSQITGSLGLAIILFAAGIRLVTLPVSIWAARSHREYTVRFERAKPEIDEAKRQYRGAEQSEQILKIYKDNGISPLSSLKGTVGLFVQIPFLLAFFHATTRSSLFANEGFLWISDLASPDRMMALPLVLPILGGYVNALPLILGAVNIASSMHNKDVTQSSKFVPILISLLIVTVFYSFSSALVLYWLAVNLLQAAEKGFLINNGSRDNRTTDKDSSRFHESSHANGK